ncbi:hypothetical protein AB0C29_06090 [Actinoplanes sp. NPDC048791]
MSELIVVGHDDHDTAMKTDERAKGSRRSDLTGCRRSFPARNGETVTDAT